MLHFFPEFYKICEIITPQRPKNAANQAHLWRNAGTICKKTI
jgi:hypothetical protein